MLGSSQGEDVAEVEELMGFEALRKPIIVDVPPPPKEMKLRLSPSALDQLLNENFEKVIGIVVPAEGVLQDGFVDADSFQLIALGAQKTCDHSPVAKSIGVVLAVYASGTDISTQSKLFKSTESAARSLSINAHIHVVDSPEELLMFLKNALLRAATYEFFNTAGVNFNGR